MYIVAILCFLRFFGGIYIKQKKEFCVIHGGILCIAIVSLGFFFLFLFILYPLTLLSLHNIDAAQHICSITWAARQLTDI